MIKDWMPIEKFLNERNSLVNKMRKDFYCYLYNRLGFVGASEAILTMKTGLPFWERAMNILSDISAAAKLRIGV